MIHKNNEQEIGANVTSSESRITSVINCGITELCNRHNIHHHLPVQIKNKIIILFFFKKNVEIFAFFHEKKMKQIQ